MTPKITYILMLGFLAAACSKSSTTSTTTTTTPIVSGTVPDVYKKIYGATSITSDGTYITIKSTGARPIIKVLTTQRRTPFTIIFQGPLLEDIIFQKIQIQSQKNLTFLKFPLTLKWLRIIWLHP
jgi:hypothetical protein